LSFEDEDGKWMESHGLTIDPTMAVMERSKMGLGRIYVVLWKVVKEGREGDANECVFVCSVLYSTTIDTMNE